MLLAAAQVLVMQVQADEGEEPGGFRSWVPLIFLQNCMTCVCRSAFIESVSSDKEIYYQFFPEQLALVLEELEGKKGDRRDLGMAEEGGEKAAGVLEEQGFMMFEKRGTKESWKTYVCKLYF